MARVHLYSGKYHFEHLYESSKRCKTKAFVFDLDETIGSFGDLYRLWCRLDAEKQTYETFRSVLSMYPEFLRYGILTILSYIGKKHQQGECTNVYLYTNNQCGFQNWVAYIIRYLDERIGTYERIGTGTLFAKPICAFQIGGKRLEPCRSGHDKTYDDFIRCSMLPTTVEVCFIDDVAYQYMMHDKVYFIQPPPYQHGLSNTEIQDRWDTWMQTGEAKTYMQIPDPENVVIFHRILYYVREFFFVALKRSKTHKNRVRVSFHFTRKNRL